jgi:hypothetical protein
MFMLLLDVPLNVLLIPAQSAAEPSCPSLFLRVWLGFLRDWILSFFTCILLRLLFLRDVRVARTRAPFSACVEPSSRVCEQSLPQLKHNCAHPHCALVVALVIVLDSSFQTKCFSQSLRFFAWQVLCLPKAHVPHHPARHVAASAVPRPVPATSKFNASALAARAGRVHLALLGRPELIFSHGDLNGVSCRRAPPTPTVLTCCFA